MGDRLIEFSLRNRFLVLLATLLIAGGGILAMRRLPIDAVPDITNVQVQVLTNAPALGPLEVEQFISFPIETAMSGLPGIEEIRSVSKFGLSAVTIVFKDGTDIYHARQLINERLQVAREEIPQGFGDPEMGPISSGLGEIYQFEVRGEGYSLMELRTILDWFIAFQLKTVPGVVEINTFGGELKTYEVQLDPRQLIQHEIPISHVFEALEANNTNAGGAYIEHNQEQYIIRGVGLIQTLEDVGNIVVEVREGGRPLYIRDLGKVAFAPMVRQGAVTRDGRGEAVTGIVMMLLGENSRVVVDRVKAKIEQIKPTLPKGVTIDTFYDRTELVRKTIHTVIKNLAEGGALVILVLLILLGNVRGGLIVASAIPLAMLIAFIGMLRVGLSGNLMSLGAIDFGLIVDGAVVIIENIMRHLAEQAKHSKDRLVVIRDAAKEVARPVIFGVGIIMIVYLPILTLQGIEGKMFTPMALTVLFALAGSLLLAFTLMPVLASLFLTGPVKEGDTKLLQWIRPWYAKQLTWALEHPKRVAAGALGTFLVSLIAVPFLGSEFIPKLDEGAIALQAWRLPSVSLSTSIQNTTLIEQTLKTFPEVETVVSKTGRPEIATDPMGVEISDIFVILKSKKFWKTTHSKEALIAAMDRALNEHVPGTKFSYSQPIELRMSELIAGVRSDIGIKVYGEDLRTLKQVADRIVAVVSKVRGAQDVKAEQITGLPVVQVLVDRPAMARYGINAVDVLAAVEALGGKVVGEIFEGQKRFALQVRFIEEARNQLDELKRLPVADPEGRLIPLGQLAKIQIEEGPAQISREAIQRRITVECNVRGRDLGGFVQEAQRAVATQVKLPSGYVVEWGGQFENLQRASARLAIVVPVALLLIFVLLYSTFGSIQPALLIYANVPMAATGGILALLLRRMPFSISAGVGFIALFGVAVLNGLVLVTYISQLRREGKAMREAVYEGAMTRLRPVLMTALVASLGFIPMALGHGEGAEVQRPLATVVIGGLITSTLLTLVVLPAIYRWFEKKEVEF
ncbi:MAG: CusA/CzcA family heavy metal efflux RND transporter [Candidatus Omnitrophota bacterium]|nr:CusA/CzcA family heavy metal efflux RND transporter [Candidatus Omnitrophota bacterium]